MRNSRRFAHGFGRLAQVGLAASLVLLGLVAFTTVASAHNNTIVGVSSCASPLGTGYTVTWTVSNDWDMSEVGTVTSVTGGLPTLHATTFTIGAQDGAYASHQGVTGCHVAVPDCRPDPETPGERVGCDHA